MPDMPNDRILDYAHRAVQPKWVTLSDFHSEMEAQLFANELDAHGIRYQLLNGSTRSTLSFYGAMVSVELQVLSDDLDAARKLLAEHARPEAANDLEPAELDDASQPRTAVSDTGETIQLIAAGVYESVHEMREAALILEAGRVDAFVPRLVPRGANPPGQGARFIVRVAEDDLPRAKSLLARQTSDESAAEPRCPRCGGWNVFEHTYELSNLLLGLIGRSKPKQCECLKCHYIGLREEFLSGESVRYDA